MSEPRDITCADPHTCITCSDAATAMRVVSIDRDIAHCLDDSGEPHDVLLGLVAGVVPGMRVLVHAGAALTIDQEAR